MFSKITRLVFSGGGAKGAVYPGAYAALKETGIFDGVEDIAGSSAGAFTASLMAVGMPHDAFQNDLKGMNFSELMGEAHNNAWITKTGQPIYDYLRKTIRDQILGFLKAQDIDESHACWPLLQALDQNDHSPSFSDLATLIQYWPKRFKRLTITAVKQNNGELKIFNIHDTPGVEIALACKASGAIPLILKPVDIEIDNVIEQYVDGAMQENIPTEFFDKDSQTNTYLKNKFRDKTLVFSFLEGRGNKKLSKWHKVREFVFGSSSVFYALHGSRKDEHENEETYKKLFNLVREELKALRQTHQEQLSFDALIDLAINNVSKRFVPSQNNSFWTRIISFFVKLWTWFIHLFSTSTATASTNAETSAEEKAENSSYFNVIRDTLKASVHSFEDKPNEQDGDSKPLSLDIPLRAYKKGPNKPPVLYDINVIERYAYDHIPKLLTPFSSKYSITNSTEKSFQRLRTYYPLRTVALGTGNLSPVDFTTATKHARFMIARGYLDTINTLSNLYLYDKQFDAYGFYSEIVDLFMKIYSEVLNRSNINTKDDELLLSLTNENHSTQFKFHLIKDTAEEHWSSNQAFALTRAVECRKKELSYSQILEEIKERVEGKEKIILPISPWFYAFKQTDTRRR